MEENSIVIETISRKVAEKYGVKPKEVDDIHRFQYQFLLETINKAEDTIHLIHIGKFIRKKPRVERGDK